MPVDAERSTNLTECVAALDGVDARSANARPLVDDSLNLAEAVAQNVAARRHNAEHAALHIVCKLRSGSAVNVVDEVLHLLVTVAELFAALIVNDDSTEWVNRSTPYLMFSWLLLGIGIGLGAVWAYVVLGWGGYWAWDPVENASLIPWLIATAALHTMLIQTRRNKLHGVNVFLMALTTVSAFFATYLVRSGVVQSVHAFGSGGVGVPLLLFILISIALSFWIALLARRSDAGELAGIESREGFLVLTSWLLLALSLIILVATMWPVFTAFWKETVMGLAREVVLDEAGHDHGGAVGLTADFYNRVCMPLFAAMVAILSICPWLGWNGGVRNMRKLLLVVCTFIGAAAAMYAIGYTLPVAVLGASASIAALVSMGLKLFERPIYSHAPSFSAYGIHIGVALIALGIAFSGPYKIESEPTMAMGETVKVGQFEVTFKNLYEGEGAGYIFLEGELEVRKDGKLIGINTLITSYSGNYSGVGFAIPVNYAVNLAQQIIAGETPTHAQLGVSLSTVSAATASRYGLPVDTGAYVAAVSAGSGAAEAGLQEGDIITALDGESVEGASDLMLAVRGKNPGDTVKLTVNRNGQEQDHQKYPQMNMLFRKLDFFDRLRSPGILIFDRPPHIATL